ncbi:hypothetical protein GCM10020216_032930 [Nonomuraea helvata]
MPGDLDRPARGRQKRDEHAKRGGLAGAVGSEKAKDLAGRHGEVDAAYGVHGSALQLERPGEAPGVDDG